MSHHLGRAPLILLGPFETEDDLKKLLDINSKNKRHLNPPGKATRADTYLQEYSESKKQVELMLSVIRKLAKNIEKPYWTWVEKEPRNNSIPAGYTYFAQLISHDISHHVAPFSDLYESSSSTSIDEDNLRGRGLILDTIYGGGPRAFPIAYTPKSQWDLDRTHLRLGKIQKKGARSNISKDFLDRDEDIMRITCPYLEKNKAEFGDTLIADNRNDDHLIISQLLVLFHKLHNKVFDRVSEFASKDPSTTIETDYARFVASRKIVALIYRKIIVFDFLEKILSPKILEFYNKENYTNQLDELLYSPNKSGVPAEFSHAALRVCHSMIRPTYKLNAELSRFASIKELLHRTSARGANTGVVPHNEDWLIEWGNFFDLTNLGAVNSAQSSNRIGPSMKSDLVVFPEGSFPENYQVTSLPQIDLLRAAENGVLKLNSIINELPEQIIAQSAILSEEGGVEELINDWFEVIETQYDSKPNDIFNSTEKRELLNNPPLLFFLLLEAAKEYDGEKLGTLGSVIVADSMFSVLNAGRSSIEDDVQVNELANLVFNQKLPTTMPQLIEFTLSSHETK